MAKQNKPHVFVISLPGSPCRARITRRLSALDISFRVVEAVDGRALSAQDMMHLYDREGAVTRLGREMGPGEIGCAISHRRVYQAMLDEGLASAVVMEDDAEIDEAFAEIWNDIDRIPDNVDVLLFQSVYGFVWRKPKMRLSGHMLHRAASPLSSAVAYFIRLSVAQAILQKSRVDSVADWPLCHRSVRQYLTLPMPVGYSSDHSSLAGERRSSQRPQRRTLSFRVARAILYFSFVPYCFAGSRYAGLRNYVDREVGWRLKRHLTPLFIDVEKLARTSHSSGAG